MALAFPRSDGRREPGQPLPSPACPENYQLPAALSAGTALRARALRPRWKLAAEMLRARPADAPAPPGAGCRPASTVQSPSTVLPVNSRYSQAFAVLQSRITVIAETFSTSAVSS